MTAPTLEAAPTLATCQDGGRPPFQPTGGQDGETDMAGSYGRAAEMVCARTYLGIPRNQMHMVLSVRESTYQRWENGRDPIPDGIWDRITELVTAYNTQIDDLVASVPADAETFPVRVWRGVKADRPFPQAWQAQVFMASLRDPRIVPKFPDDENDE